MASPNIETFREVRPFIYSWDTPDIPKYQGWEKIGYTEQDSVDARIAQQASQLGITKHKNWARLAVFTSEAGGRFTDHEFHAYLSQHGVTREVNPRTEWFHFAGAPKRSIDYFNDFAGQDYSELQTSGTDYYVLRPEQAAAVSQTINTFSKGATEMLWNAKPRFGKTLTTYDLIRQMDFQKVLIVTNRPAIANSWYDDFVRFIGHQTSYKFVSESPSLSARKPMTRSQWRRYSRDHLDEDPRIIEFLSLQDLKGSQYFGGDYNKLKHVADFEWDLLVVDEAHEGVDTAKTGVAFDHIKRVFTLHLSGTPFKALASGRFSPDQIYNWTYADEREALAGWNTADDNPYAALPTLNMLTYQMSRMISDRLAIGIAVDDEKESIDYAFDLQEFFATDNKGNFEHRDAVAKFLDTLTTNEKYPFSTPELRNEIRHSFWLLNRVASATALARLLREHPVFKDYEVVLAVGNQRTADEDEDEDDSDVVATGKSLDKVRAAIARAEETGGRTITLSVGQLTTGVTVPEWTAVLMLANLNSPAAYMQAAFRSQNPCTLVRGERVWVKKNAYIFDFAPERTLVIYDAFANNLRPNPSNDPSVRQDNIRTLLNFFPVIGEDTEGRMVELDAAQVLTFPQVFKAREVVRRGFLSNLLFDNVAGIFRYAEHYEQILSKLPVAKQGKINNEQFTEPQPPLHLDDHGKAHANTELVINPKVERLGKPVWKIADIEAVVTDAPRHQIVEAFTKVVTDKLRSSRQAVQADYGLTAAQVRRDEQATAKQVRQVVERALTERDIARKHLEDESLHALTECEALAAEQKLAAADDEFRNSLLKAMNSLTEEIPRALVTREEDRKEQSRADKAMESVRSHLRGFARTIPMFLMAYGDRDMRLANFEDYTPDNVFEEIAGISESEFQTLRDGQDVTEADGTIAHVPGLFDEPVFDQAIQEFLNKKAELADYFDDSLTEDIFAYVPQQKTSLVFTPRAVVTQMIDLLETDNPGIFNDPTKTFADPFSTAGLFLMELVRRLDNGLASVIPNQTERLRHILTKQVFELSHNQILHDITIEAVSGGVAERKRWLAESGHYRVGNIAQFTPDELHSVVDSMLNGKD